MSSLNSTNNKNDINYKNNKKEALLALKNDNRLILNNNNLKNKNI